MENSKCLNCGLELNGRYCSGCGQKSDTHPISLKHFVFHDVLHGAFHIEKGMLFTAKQAITRPGKGALDYISGKRISYYNVFYFILILIGVNMLLINYHNTLALKIDPEKAFVKNMDDVGKRVDQFLSSYGKLLIFAMVPLTALNSFLVFRRRRLNYVEHFFISGMLLLGIGIIITFFSALSFLDFTGISNQFLDFIYGLLPYALLLYLIFGYYNAFRENYTLIGFSTRLTVFLILFSGEVILFLILLFGAVTDWKGGTIQYSI